MKLGTETHDAQRMDYKDFSDPLTFPLVPPTSQSFTYPVNKHKKNHGLQAMNHNSTKV